MDILRVLAGIGGIILMVGIFIVFPIYAAIQARKKGRKGWAIAIIITTFILYGWLTGLISMFLPSKKNVTEKCPYCNYEQAVMTEVMVDKNTGEQIPSTPTMILLILATVICFGFGITMAILAWSVGDDGVIRFVAGSTIAGLAYLSIGISFGIYPLKKVIAYFKADREMTDVYHCEGCKQRWNKYTKGLPDNH